MSNDYKLNPEIKKQFDKLNFLIEQELEKGRESERYNIDDVAMAVRDAWGNELKNSDCYDLLEYASDLSKTTSEMARYGVEDGLRIMKDSEAQKVYSIFRTSKRITDWWYDKDMKLERKLSLFNTWMHRLRNDVKEIETPLYGLFMYRSIEYREELDELKEQLSEAS